MAIVIYPDPLVDSLPQPMRHAYRAAECALFSADNVHDMVVRMRADLLPGAIGRLLACLGEQEVAVRAVEAELATARGSVPFVGMGQAFTTAHIAGVHYGWELVSAIDFAAPSKTLSIVDAWGAKRAALWGEYYRRRLLERGVIAIEGDTVRPGPEWQAFRMEFLRRLPGVPTANLQTHMRLEIAAWTKGQETKEHTAPISQNLFARLPGNRFLIVFGNKSETLPALEGLRAVEFLLKQPGKAAHILRINWALSETHSRAGSLEAAGARSEESQRLDGFTDDASWAPDPYSEETLRKVEEAVEGLDARAAEARKRGDCIEAERLENEAEQARDLIREQRGLATRKRRKQPDQDSPAERVRSKLTNNFRNALRELRTKYAFPELAAHLEEQIDRGAEWKYRPAPGVDWAFTPPTSLSAV
jgi:hypothetical protein